MRDGVRRRRALFALVLAACAAMWPVGARAEPVSCLRRGDAAVSPQSRRTLVQRPRGRAPARVAVPVRFHVVTSGQAGLVSREGVERQIQSLNAAYGGRTGGADTGTSFRLAGVDVTDDPRWFARPNDHRNGLATLARGGPGTLNLYTAAVGYEMLGFSTFPQWYRGPARLDGVVVDYRTLPGGAFQRFNRGYTAVHETGHWLGLFHPFENGCRPPGDGVDDTPYEGRPSQGCPGYKDTCAAPGSDPVHNFMDYGFDACMNAFTPGQGLRIRQMWATYRS
jgi:Pregnancy-associated plasma protein-A